MLGFHGSQTAGHIRITQKPLSMHILSSRPLTSCYSDSLVLGSGLGICTWSNKFLRCFCCRCSVTLRNIVLIPRVSLTCLIDLFNWLLGRLSPPGSHPQSQSQWAAYLHRTFLCKRVQGFYPSLAFTNTLPAVVSQLWRAQRQPSFKFQICHLESLDK